MSKATRSSQLSAHTSISPGSSVSMSWKHVSKSPATTRTSPDARTGIYGSVATGKRSLTSCFSASHQSLHVHPRPPVCTRVAVLGCWTLLARASAPLPESPGSKVEQASDTDYGATSPPLEQREDQQQHCRIEPNFSIKSGACGAAGASRAGLCAWAARPAQARHHRQLPDQSISLGQAGWLYAEAVFLNHPLSSSRPPRLEHAGQEILLAELEVAAGRSIYE